MADFTIISKETVAMLDQYVFKGAGKWAVRGFFVLIALLVLNQVWEFAPKVSATVSYLESAKAYQAVHNLAASTIFNTLITGAILLFIILSGPPVIMGAVGLFSAAWRRPKLINEQITQAWRESSWLKRGAFCFLALFVGGFFLLMYAGLVVVQFEF